jgi:hypothetical protein
VGAGAGDYAAAWLAGGLQRITLSELDPHLLGELRSRFEGDERVTVRELDVAEASEGSHSAVVAFNALEHIDDHVDARRSAQKPVRPGGAIVMLVPAFEFAMSRFEPRHRALPALYERDARRRLPGRRDRARAARLCKRARVARLARRDEVVQA